VDVVLVAPPAAVARALQISGLWLRFPVEEYEAVEDDRVDREGGPR
jgi:stage II sporulation protein AA (anti-sigma F factor antagonist)